MVEHPSNFRHTAVRLHDSIIVVSDEKIDGELQPVIWMHNLYTEQWKKCRLEGERNVLSNVVSGACGAAIKTDVYFFGGWTSDGRKTNKLWKLASISQGCFQSHEIDFEKDVKLPSPRSLHTAWEHGEHLWIFGGVGPFSDEYLNNNGVAVGDWVMNNQLLCYDPSIQQWMNPQCLGDVPSPRLSHCTTIIGDNVFLFGGTNQMIHFDDLYQLDMMSYTWTMIHTSQTRPQNRLRCSLMAVSGKELVLYDGVEHWIMDLFSQTWTQQTVNNSCQGFFRTGSFGINRCAIIVVTERGSCSTVHMRLEPKSLQQLAMTIIHAYQYELSREMLPRTLVMKLGLESSIV